MDEYQPIYQVYHLVFGELVKDFESKSKEKAMEKLHELQSNGMKQAHIQYAFNRGGIARKFDNGGSIPAIVEKVPTDPELLGMKGQLQLFADVEMKFALTKENVAEQLISDREAEKDPQLTMLSFGGGQDSWAILYSLIHDPEFRRTYAPKDLVVVMSDTGNEHPYTYKGIEEARILCEKHDIPFHFITNDQGFHTPGWMTLKDNLIRNSVILSATMSSKPCTASLKINPLDKYLHHFMCQKYGFPELANKESWKFYFNKFQTKVRVLIGFAKDEERRVINSMKILHTLPKWKQKYVQYVFPLIEKGWNRNSAQEIIREYHPYLIPPSNCMICFYQSDMELIWLNRFYPAEFEQWESMERAKLNKFAHIPKNYGVYGTLTLSEKLEVAKSKTDENGKAFGDYTDAELWEYKMSHGHNVKSAF